MDAAHTALSNTLIIRLLMSYLTWKDLSSCRQVCHLWAKEINSMVKRRSAMTYALIGDGTERIVESDAAAQLPPAVSLIFIRSNINRDHRTTYKIRNLWLKEVKKYRNPGQGPLITVLSRCVSRVPWPSDDVKGKTLLCGLSIPHIEGVQVNALKFIFPRIKLMKIAYSPMNDPVEWPILKSIMKDNIVMCVLVFANEAMHRGDTITDLMAYILSRQENHPQFAICGGLVESEHLDYGDKTINQAGVTLVLFSIPKRYESTDHFQAYSNIFLQRENQPNEEEINEKLRAMAENIKLLKYSVAFKFGDIPFGNKDEFFTNHFPNTSMISCASSIKVAIVNILPDESSPERKKKKEGFKDIFHYKTTLVILTWSGEKLNNEE